MDIRDALQTAENVNQASEAVHRVITACLLLSQWPVSIKSQVASETRKRLSGKGLLFPVLNTPLMERTAFKKMVIAHLPLAGRAHWGTMG
jgi:hypothetical protein